MSAIPTLSLTETQALTALRSFLLGVVSSGTQVIRGEINRVAEPAGTDFIVITPLFQERLEFNETSYYDNLIVGSIAPETASVTGSIAPNTANPAPAILTVTSITSGILVIGGPISGGTIATGTVILAQTGGTTGGIGTYLVSGIPQTVASTAIVQTYGTLTVSTVTRGSLAVGNLLTDGSWPNVVASGTVITALGTGTGSVGTYSVVPSQTLGSETLYAGVRADLVGTKWTVQLDIHGPRSGNNAKVIETLFRSEVAVEAFNAAVPGYNVVPLYCGEARQTPFISAEQQYEFRWSMDAVMQINPTVSTPQMFFDEIAVTAINVDATYPP